jgi:hypothetical protein
MELEGSLKAFSLPEVLQFLNMGKMTGVLTIQKEDTTVSLVIKKGKIIDATMAGRIRPLGQLLIDRGLLKRSDLEEVLGQQQTIDTDKRVGQILVDRHIVSMDQLRDALRLQIEEDVWDLFSWDQGYFKFEYSTDQTLADALVEIDIEPILIEGSRRLDEWHKIIKNIPSDDVVPAIRPLVDTAHTDMALSDQEWTVLSLVNGYYNVGAICNRSGFGRFETYRILNACLLAGIVSIRSADEARTIDKDLLQQAMQTLRKEREETRDEEESAGIGLRRLGSLLFRSKQQARTEVERAMDFLSPIGVVSSFTNNLLVALLLNKEFSSSLEEDARLIADYWREVVMNHPKADMLKVSIFTIEPAGLEKFIGYTGYSDAIRTTFEESLEALKRFSTMLYKLACQRLGEKTASRIVTNLLSDYVGKSKLKLLPDFNLENWVRNVMK